MLLRALRGLGMVIVLILLVFVCSKAIVRSLPGDPVDAILAETGSSIPPEILRKDLGLDRPFREAAYHQLEALLLHFDWGRSISRKQEIGPLLRERAAASFELGILSLFSALLFSFALAFWAQFPNRMSRSLQLPIQIFSALSASLPTAWIGPILGLLFAVKLRFFSLTGGLALPALTLSIALSGFWLRTFNDLFSRALRSDVVRTARSKGLGELKVVWKHAFLPTSGPLLAYLGSQTGVLLAGAVITETTFDRPGLGSLLVESIFKRDYPLIEAILILSAASILMGNFLGDLLQEWVQPKLRSTGATK